MYKMLLGLLALIGISFQPELQDTSKPEPFCGVICRTEKQAATLARYTFSRLIEGVEAIKKVNAENGGNACGVPDTILLAYYDSESPLFEIGDAHYMTAKLVVIGRVEGVNTLRLLPKPIVRYVVTYKIIRLV